MESDMDTYIEDESYEKLYSDVEDDVNYLKNEWENLLEKANAILDQIKTKNSLPLEETIGLIENISDYGKKIEDVNYRIDLLQLSTDDMYLS
jgi:uncharacterized protein YoxC